MWLYGDKVLLYFTKVLQSNDLKLKYQNVSIINLWYFMYGLYFGVSDVPSFQNIFILLD